MAVLLCGIGARLVLILQGQLGYAGDCDTFLGWTLAIWKDGLGRFLSNEGFCDYPPLGLLIMWVVGHATSLLDPKLYNNDLLASALKAPSYIADLLIAAMVFAEARRLFGPKRALAALSLFYLNPVTIYNSAYWGQMDAVHTALLLGALCFIARRRWGATGFMTALAVLFKFQSIAIVPLILLETYRYRAFRGIGVFLSGAVVAAALVCLPFAWHGVLDDVLVRGYVNVVGQYNTLSPSAFNVWHLLGAPSYVDTGVPPVAALVVADGQSTIPADALPLNWLTWRKLSLAAYALSVALIISLFSYRHGTVARMAAAGQLALAFFLIPTEMHERYAHPAFAFLVIWAVTGPWRERLYALLTTMILLNLAQDLAPVGVAGLIAATIVAILLCLLVWTVCSRGQARVADLPDEEPSANELPPPASRLVAAFRGLTYVTLSAVLIGCGVAGYVAFGSWRQLANDMSVTYLSDLEPITRQQGWGRVELDRSVEGGVIMLDDKIFLRGLGTHAPSTVTYRIPAGATEFRAVLGINHCTNGQGSADASGCLVGKSAYEAATVRGGGLACDG
jgi:Gpi18-like mannosyltransferase